MINHVFFDSRLKLPEAINISTVPLSFGKTATADWCWIGSDVWVVCHSHYSWIVRALSQRVDSRENLQRTIYLPMKKGLNPQIKNAQMLPQKVLLSNRDQWGLQFTSIKSLLNDLKSWIISGNAPKTKINRRPNHNFHRQYAYHSQMGASWHCFTPINHHQHHYESPITTVNQYQYWHHS